MALIINSLSETGRLKRYPNAGNFMPEDKNVTVTSFKMLSQVPSLRLSAS
jgi:hypothetical protein